MPGHELLIGTSGFDYTHWAGSFYPDDLPPRRRLEFYADHFRALELNVTFYRTPRARTFAAWRDRVPPSFRFAVKASRYLTHTRRLRDPRAPVEYLMERVSRLEDRLGPILVQLPPTMTIELDRLHDTLTAFGRSVRVAIEPRHPSWFSEELYGLLADHGAALCLADRRGPIVPVRRTAPWLYLRLHAGLARPESCYGRQALRSWATRLTDVWPSPLEGFVFFNNDAHACAVDNARTFERLLGRRRA